MGHEAAWAELRPFTFARLEACDFHPPQRVGREPTRTAATHSL